MENKAFIRGGEMRKILFVIQDLSGGGAEKVLINILNNIDYSKYSVDLLLLYEDGIYLEEINRNVKLKFVIPKRDKNKYRNIYNSFIHRVYTNYPRLCSQIFLNQKYDVEIAFLEGSATSFLSMSPNKHSKKIAWVHTNLLEHRASPLKGEKEAYKNIDKIICVSEQSKQKLLELYPEYVNKTRVIYNLIDKKGILNLANEKKEICMDTQFIVAAGRLVSSKRYDLLIKAHKLLLEEGVDQKLLILGEGELRKELEQLIKNLKVEESVLMPGFIKNPYPYIKNCDVYAMSSDYEGLPLVITEAMTLGKAIVSSDCTGASELLGYGKYGVIVRRDDEYLLKDEIKKILLNKELRVNIENKALEGSKLLNSDVILEQIVSILSPENK